MNRKTPRVRFSPSDGPARVLAQELARTTAALSASELVRQDLYAELTRTKNELENHRTYVRALGRRVELSEAESKALRQHTVDANRRALENGAMYHVLAQAITSTGDVRAHGIDRVKHIAALQAAIVEAVARGDKTPLLPLIAQTLSRTATERP